MKNENRKINLRRRPRIYIRKFQPSRLTCRLFPYNIMDLPDGRQASIRSQMPAQEHTTPNANM